MIKWIALAAAAVCVVVVAVAVAVAAIEERRGYYPSSED